MRRTALLLLAAASIHASLLHGTESTRPRYGGQLRMEINALVRDLDPATRPAAGEAAAKRNLMRLVFENLVRFDDQGRPQGALAMSWQADASRTRWAFEIRPRVKFHDGTPLTPALAASLLAATLADRRVSANADAVIIAADNPIPDLLWELESPAHALVFRDAAGKAQGTGPFKISEWQEQRALLTANQSYWDGRPFLDGIILEMGRSGRDQLLDLELAKTDVVELPPQEARRVAAGSAMIGSSAPVELMALVFNRLNPAQQEVRRALALSIDRNAIHSVLVQKHGEVAWSLLPGWLSGYAFLFAPPPETGAAGRSAGSSAGISLVLAYEPADPLAKATADRIAVDARKAGITIRALAAAGPKAEADIRLVRALTPVTLPVRALIELAELLGVGDRVNVPLAPSVDAAYEMERSLLEDNGIIPLLRLPEMYAAGSRVRGWNSQPVARTGILHLEDLWLAAERQ